MASRFINRSLRRRQSSSGQKAMIEALEPRQLLTAAVADVHMAMPQILHLAPVVAMGPLAGATPSATVVTSDVLNDTAVYGNTLTLTATVNDITATGVVTFFDGASSLGNGTVGVNGTWTLPIATLHAGAHSITAVYGGDSSFDASTSSILTVTITAKPLTVTGITAGNKPYDHLTAATLTTTNASLVGVLAGDTANVTLVKTNASGNFTSANAATGSTVTVAGLTLSGSAAADYTVTQPTTTANITPLALTVTGITAGNKVYDRLTTATLTTTNATLVGVLSADNANVTLVKTNASGNFAGASVATGSTVTVAGLTLSGSAAGNYTVTQPTTTANITPVTLTVSGLTANKTYDGLTTATLNSSNATFTGIVTGDTANVTLSTANSTASFASAGVGTTKTVTIAGLTLSGSAAGNYTLTQPTITADIAAKALTVTGITAANKVYDGLTTSTLTTTNATLAGVVAGDTANVTLVKTNASGSFSDANVANGKTVTLAGLTISGSTAANYTLTQPTTTANITAKPLTASGITAANKVYNGSVAATVTVGTVTLTGVIAADLANVAFVNGGVTGAFANANVGNGKTVTLSGLSLSGNASANYSITATTTANVTAKALTLTGVTAANKVYDGGTSATLSFVNAIVGGILASDTANVTLATNAAIGSFANANVGNDKTVTITGVTLSGSGAGNYTITTASTGANITPKGLTITGLKAANKVYDHTTTATLTTSSAAITGLIAGEKVTLVKTNASGNFSDANVGTGKTVTVSGLTLTGTAAANYAITTATATANITPKTLTISGVTGVNKVYDGTTDADLNLANGALNGIVDADSDDVDVDTVTGTFASANVANNVKVAINVTLSGNAGSNYTVATGSTTANITPRALTVTGVTADKVYNGTVTPGTVDISDASLTGILTADLGKVGVSKGSAKTTNFSSANAGTSLSATLSGMTLTGTAAKNYTLTQPSITAHITPKAITVNGVTGNNKTYDGTTTATLVTTSTTFTGLVAADKTNVTLSATNATANFASANVGAHLAITIDGLSLSGSAAGNYTLTQPGAFGNITPKALTVTGITASNKTYNGTTVATIITTNDALVGVVGGDSSHVILIDDSAIGTFASKDAGTAKTVTISGLTISGSAAANYTLTQPTTTANITARALTVTGITVGNKIYDGSATSSTPVTTSAAALVGLISGDAVTLVKTNAAGTFANANVGNGKTVTLSGLTLTGSGAANYTVTQPTTTANITPLALTVTGITADKVYNGNLTAIVDASDASLVGVLNADTANVTLHTNSAVAANFDSANVGTHSLAITGLTITGSATSNYSITQPTITAHITPKTITVTGITVDNKTYDNTTAATLGNGVATLHGVIAGDTANVAAVKTAATGTFNDKNADTEITVTIAGVTLSGSAAGNYTLTQPTASADITPKAITATGITASNKVYDGTDAAEVDTTSASFAGIFASDLADVSIDGASGTFATPNAGTGLTVTVAVVLSGDASGNYTVTPPTTTATITPLAITVSGINANKTYNGTTAATLNFQNAIFDGVVDADAENVSLSGTAGTFTNANVGSGKTVTPTALVLTGSAAANYTLTLPTITATIAAKALTVTGITANDKNLDGNATATLVTTNAALVGVVTADLANVNLVKTNALGTFSQTSGGTSLTVTISGLTLSGSAISNYTLTQPTTTASILIP